jgi:hypothetical protein
VFVVVASPVCDDDDDDDDDSIDADRFVAGIPSRCGESERGK